MKNYLFVGELRKGCISYYFEVKQMEIGFTADDKVAYIEKLDTSKNNSSNAGYFTIDKARKCYKALLNKGFKLIDED